MFFHVDESGNSGSHLFDDNQPVLSYGVLSSTLNVDILGKELHSQILHKLGSSDIHANHLGVAKLTEISGLLIDLQSKFKFNFDYYFIEKKALAVVLFFDAVFDSGLNEAVMWHWYWTPLRFLLLYKVSELFDDKLLKESHSLCTIKNIEKHQTRVVSLLSELKTRASEIQDKRCKEVIMDALTYGISYPLRLDFEAPDKNIISPNSVGYQFVLSSISRRTRKKSSSVMSVVVDLQNQFNSSQAELHEIKHRMSSNLASSKQEDKNWYLNHPLFATFDKETILEVIPDIKPKFSDSKSSIGLQIVDVYLWIINRKLNGKSLSVELEVIANLFLKNARCDGISMKGMANRFNEYEKMLPPLNEVTKEQNELNKMLIERHNEKLAKIYS